MRAILVVAIATSTSIAVLTERIAYRPFRRVAGLAPLICAIGVSFFLEQTFRGMFGSAVKSYPEPQWQRAAFARVRLQRAAHRRAGDRPGAACSWACCT